MRIGVERRFNEPLRMRKKERKVRGRIREILKRWRWEGERDTHPYTKTDR